MTTSNQKPPAAWLTDYQTAYGIEGMIALSWGLGSLFAEQIRQQHGYYPFLLVTGEAGSGKTALSDSLLRIYGSDSQAINPHQSTLAGLIRQLTTPPCGPVVLEDDTPPCGSVVVEDDNLYEDDNLDETFNHFDWDVIKDIYNDNSEIKFKAALMVVHTNPMIAPETVIARCVKVQFDRTNHTPEGSKAIERLYQQPDIDMIGFHKYCLSRVDTVMQVFNLNFYQQRSILTSQFNNASARTIYHHAMLIALAECLQVVLRVSDVTVAEIRNALIEKIATKHVSA